jgi:hypothetical protein
VLFFLSKLLFFFYLNNQNEVTRAIELREIVTSLGPAYVKLGQALSIRPDILSPAAMIELQKLCDKVTSYNISFFVFHCNNCMPLNFIPLCFFSSKIKNTLEPLDVVNIIFSMLAMKMIA